MPYPPKVEKLRSLVQSELARGKYPFPVELVLSLIRFESAGRIGAINTTSGASGLMQVMAIALKEFNRRTGSKLKMSDLRGKTLAAAKKQVSVGLWVLGDFWRKAYKYIRIREPHVPVDDLTTLADLFYAAGPGKIKPKFKKLPRVTFDTFKARYPKHKATLHASNVWGLTEQNDAQWNLPAIDRFVTKGQDDTDIEKPAKEGFLLALLLVAVVWFFFQKQKKKEV